MGTEHLYLWTIFFRRVPTVGALFLVDFVAGLVLGAEVLVSRRAPVMLLAGGFAAATFCAFLWSHFFVLFGFREKLLGRWQIAAAATELAAVACAVLCAALALTSGRASAAHRTAVHNP